MHRSQATGGRKADDSGVIVLVIVIVSERLVLLRC